MKPNFAAVVPRRPGGWQVSRRNAGQALVEYALVLTCIALVTIVVMSYLGVQIRGVFEPIISALDAVRAAI